MRMTFPTLRDDVDQAAIIRALQDRVAYLEALVAILSKPGANSPGNPSGS